MKHLIIALFSLLLTSQSVQAAEFSLTSPQIVNGGSISNKYVFNGFGCTGENISPQLAWTHPPAGTKSFAVTVYDPDAPTGSGWWHWVVFNLPANTQMLALNSGNPDKGLLPKGAVQSRTDYGKPGYGGPCPPPGDKPHRYFFTVYALKVDRIPLDENAPAAMVGYYLHQNMLGKAVLMATYGR